MVYDNEKESFFYKFAINNLGFIVAKNELKKCDSGGIQTHDLQNRNLTFYSAELRSHLVAKIQKNRIFATIFFHYFFISIPSHLGGRK